MSSRAAQQAVSGSALVVAAVFAYRKLVQPSTATTTAGSTASFVTGFLFLYVSLSLIAEAAPPLGGMFAVLVATGDLLANGQGLVQDLNSGLKAETTAAKG